MGGNNEFFENFERNKYLKKLPSMQRVNKLVGANAHANAKDWVTTYEALLDLVW